ncbi:GGDEF domain-containing protein [Sulfuriferula sp. AH1]|uniref:GGDEF domain-containing protein n=1 Tax=Sulfuriferula sp. AH1 TaxID=1985873 RepID=UPI0012F7ABED|nr:GGDEF domain-containing protein [Sulfuriferula sp. AH1]
MMAQSDTLGTLYLEFPALDEQTRDDAIPAADQALAAMLAKHLAMVFANLRLRDAIRQQSIRDPLSGLYNRRYLEETMQRDLSRVARKQLPLAVIMLDIDHFKRFNDTFGHEAGDAVLQSLARLLLSHMRASDVACRYGGEEFVLLLPDTPLETAHQRAEELRTAVHQLQVNRQGRPLGPVSISMGVAVFPEHGTTAEDLIRAADTAMYEAKHSGRDRVCLAQVNA